MLNKKGNDMRFYALKKTILATMAVSAFVVGVVSAETIPVTDTSTTSTTGSTTATTSHTTTETTTSGSTTTTVESTTNPDGTVTTTTTTTTTKKPATTATLPDFPSRNVVIVRQDDGHKTFSQYMADQLSNVFRYPYYHVTTREYDGTIDLSNLEDMANNDAEPADRYVSPRAEKDEYISSYHSGMTGIYRKNFNGDNNVHTEVQATLYYYDAKTHEGGTISKGFYGTESDLTMPSHTGVYKDVVDRMLKQLPFKRIPTDQARYGASTSPDASSTDTSSSVDTSKDPQRIIEDILKNPKSTSVTQLLDALQAKSNAKFDFSKFLTI